MSAARGRQGFKQWWVGALVCLLGAGVTAVLVRQQLDAAQATRQDRFFHEAQASTQAIAQRIQAYTQVVAGFRDLFLVQSTLSADQFKQIVQQYNLPETYPEFVNLSFVRHVPAFQLADYERRMRAQRYQTTGTDSPFIHSIDQTDHSSDGYIIEYLWPQQGSENVLGLNIVSQPANLAAVLVARSTHGPALSAPFSLIQDPDGARAVTLRFPIYLSMSDAGTEAPMPLFIGAVGSVIQVEKMLDGLRHTGVLRGLSVQLYDEADTEALVVGRATPEPFGVSALEGTTLPLFQPLQATQRLAVLDRHWQVQYTQAQPLLSPTERNLPWWIAGIGLALSLLLGALVHYLCNRHRRAVFDIAATAQALETSEERISALFNQAAVGVALTDAQTGCPVRANQRYAAILGYTPEEIKQLPFQTLTHPADQDRDQALSRQLQSGEIPELQLEKRMRHKDGYDVWVEINVSPILQGGVISNYQIAILQDITQRRQLQDALQASEHHLRTLLDHLPVGVCLVDAQQNIVFRNQQFLQICGYDAHDMPDAHSWWVLTFPNPSDRRQVRHSWEQQWRNVSILGESRALLETAILCKDGQIRTVELSGLKFGAEYLLTLVDLTARKLAEEEIHYLAYHDALTSLPNRRLLVDRLQQALAVSGSRRQYGALLTLDLDNFKTLNETRGHDVGDELLRQVAQRLQDCLGAAQTIARHGDDEFAVVLGGLGSSAEAAAQQVETVGQKILNTLRTPYQLQNVFHYSSVSVGVCLFLGRGEKVDELLRRADLAMYQAKSAGRNTLRFYDPHMQDIVRGRAALESDLRVGLEQNQFEIFYQAQVGPVGIMGCEALLRWNHPRDGYVSPAVFIPLAEESSLILPLGDWVLRSACRQLVSWSQDPAMAGLRLSINVSPRQFRQPDFVDQVLAALASTGADARRLALELTEGLLLQNLGDTVHKMERLKSYGISFALDDFGTGYSSLAYLKRLPLDELKIDQSFVRDILTDPNDATIVRTIVALGLSLGLQVIAEGVETSEQRDFLQRNHCHAWQGYLFSHPVPAADFQALVQTNWHDRLLHPGL